MNKYFRKIEQDFKPVIKVNPTKESLVFYVPSICNELFLEIDDSIPSEKCAKMHNDVYLLFNQKRLESLGVDSIKAFLDSLMPQDDKFAELRKNVSDAELLHFIKSRRLQEPSEIKVWMEYLSSEFNKNIQSVQDSLKSLENKAETSENVSEV